jgi:hypothetical protein
MSKLQPPLRKLVLFWMSLLSVGLLLSWPLSTLGGGPPVRAQTLGRGRRPPKAAPPTGSRPPAHEPVLADDPSDPDQSRLVDRLDALATSAPTHVVLGFNELGMHCMNRDFSEMCILPPYNTLRAQVIKRGAEPDILNSGVTVSYSIPGNTISSTKTDFWTQAPKLFGKTLTKDVGLTGNKLSGTMKGTTLGYFEATGIPITPLTDKLVNDPFQLSSIVVKDKSGKQVATTKAVVPVSWEISCHLCHNTPGISVATDILRAHDRLHGTTIEKQKPVLCASCHADPALGTTGKPGVSNFSRAMHNSHATRMAQLPNLQNACYACHPGVQTECQRDVHAAKGVTCVNCHGDMAAVAAPPRRPWVDEPTCASCHQKRKPNFDFEQPGKLFKESKGHGGVACASCHGPQHATAPALTPNDNAQAILQQGTAGTISKCTVCHTSTPREPFFHKVDD